MTAINIATTMTLPILYSLKHCPYAMRARMAIYRSRVAVLLRDVKLNNKPSAMLEASAKGTVPILVVSPTHVIDESIDVMLWSLGQRDPDNLLRKVSCYYPSNLSLASLTQQSHPKESNSGVTLNHMLAFIAIFDNEFKGCLERYKAAKRYHDPNLLKLRQACEVYIQDLEQRLRQHTYLIDEHESVADMAVFVFIRQFSKVERAWFVQSSYIKLQEWLQRYLQSAMFNKVMAEYPVWEEGSEPLIFKGN